MNYAGDLTPVQTWELLRDNPDSVLVDVRTEAEWRVIGVPDVSSLGKDVRLIQWVTDTGEANAAFTDELAAAVKDRAEDAPVLFICRSGQRSVGAAIAATQAGIGPSYNVLDGFEGPVGPDGQRSVRGWKIDGLPWRRHA
jgi:rhodanese-related sulfurtransferase